MERPPDAVAEVPPTAPQGSLGPQPCMGLRPGSCGQSKGPGHSLLGARQTFEALQPQRASGSLLCAPRTGGSLPPSGAPGDNSFLLAPGPEHGRVSDSTAHVPSPASQPCTPLSPRPALRTPSPGDSGHGEGIAVEELVLRPRADPPSPEPGPLITPACFPRSRTVSPEFPRAAQRLKSPGLGAGQAAQQVTVGQGLPPGGACARLRGGGGGRGPHAVSAGSCRGAARVPGAGPSGGRSSVHPGAGARTSQGRGQVEARKLGVSSVWPPGQSRERA